MRFEEMPRGAARRELATRWPPELVDSALDAWATMVTNPEPVTNTVEHVTGVPAHTFHQWATDHAPDFR